MNGSRETKPWCYTIDPNKRWEFCNIPLCPGENLTFTNTYVLALPQHLPRYSNRVLNTTEQHVTSLASIVLCIVFLNSQVETPLLT